ncbi:PelD GGDEF domain-containing protein [Herbaspirillum sp. alder98]|uniref:PelD GGDEF domain-containing protein n=1 Tax=Herbaspirillum sp. alder98 TaxID=2913096 RepID=UPI001CD899FF|nr:PelD GGDEF domain-containing protein [Herbaspirillum sp. alder98]MCA1324231.1 PelD GGDEF domain-containing protein [Herbaspirillum sp. alder98]
MSKSEQQPESPAPRKLAANARPLAQRMRRGSDFWSRLFARFDTDTASPRKAFWRTVETVALVLASLVLSRWMAPDDPFGVQAQFPWIWVVPAVLAMRYGTTLGVLAVVTMLAAWQMNVQLLSAGHGDGPVSAADAFPQSYFLGGLVLTLLCGQFAEVWNARSRRLMAINAYLDERLTMLTKNHFLLRLSHERLEQDLLAKPLTLRDSLDRMRSLTLTQTMLDPARLPAADAFLQVLVQSCQIEIASVHACDADGKLLLQPLASVGKAEPFNPDDPLVQYSLAQGKLAHIQTESVHQNLRNQSRYLLSAPLLNFEGKLFGLLLVEQLPFVALNEDTLQLMSVLIDYYADGIEMGTTSRAIIQQLPTCPPQMAVDLVRLHHLKRNTDIDSSLVALVFGNDETSRDMFDQIRRLKRAADVIWTYTAGERNVLMTLLPLAGSAAVDGYLMRIEAVSHAQFGNKFLSNYAEVHTAAVGQDEPARLLPRLVERCAD